jgi:hypothetical protein
MRCENVRFCIYLCRQLTLLVLFIQVHIVKYSEAFMYHNIGNCARSIPPGALRGVYEFGVGMGVLCRGRLLLIWHVEEMPLNGVQHVRQI